MSAKNNTNRELAADLDYVDRSVSLMFCYFLPFLQISLDNKQQIV
jgi:hypothetical protein